MALISTLLGGYRIYIIIGAVVALWFVYGWGSSIIQTYNTNIAKISRLERDAALRETRLASKQTVIERQRAAINASKCKAQIDQFIKDPDLLKPVDPFPNGGA